MEDKLRILHLYKDYHPVRGGIENYVGLLARAQAAAGHDVTVLVAQRKGMKTSDTMEDGVRVIRAKRWGTLASTPISPAFFRQAGRLKADLAHLHFPHPPGEVAWLWHRPSPRAVMTFHCDIVRQKGILRLYRPLMKRVLRGMDRILVSSPPMMDNPALDGCRDRCAVVPFAVDLGPFAVPDAGEKRAARRRLGLPEEGPLLLFVGVLRYYKSLETLIEAMPRIPTRAAFVAVGEGPMRGAWEVLAARSPAAGRIRFAGRAPDEALADWYRAADLFVLPSGSRAEAFGLVLLEAMACGLPCVTTEVGTGTSWVNLHGETGVVVPPNEPGELADAVTALLGTPDRMRQMGANARRRVETHFTVEGMMAALDRIYRDVAGAAAEGPGSGRHPEGRRGR
ncbi:MAG: glycosyltransferase [Acidobacteria bacterium]|nr:glycosyltransferase [Acidobacteriota bacterium]